MYTFGEGLGFKTQKDGRPVFMDDTLREHLRVSQTRRSYGAKACHFDDWDTCVTVRTTSFYLFVTLRIAGCVGQVYKAIS